MEQNGQELLQKIKEASVKSSGNKLEDHELDGVTGGFIEPEDRYSSFGKSVVCPKCGASDLQDFGTPYEDSFLRVTEYTCLRCGASFVLDPVDGGCWHKSDFLALCKSNGYKYGN